MGVKTRGLLSTLLAIICIVALSVLGWAIVWLML